MKKPAIGNIDLDNWTPERIIEAIGGLEEHRRGTREFRMVMDKWHEQEGELNQKHSGKWVAVTKDGLLAVEDSMHEAFAQARASGLSAERFVVQFIDPEPTGYIL